MADKKVKTPDSGSGDLYPFSELTEMCPINSSPSDTKLSYSSFSVSKDINEKYADNLPGVMLKERGFQIEDDDILQQPLLSSDFTGEGQIVKDEDVTGEGVTGEGVVTEP